ANIYDMDEMMEVALIDGDTTHLPRPLTPYSLLESPKSTAINPKLPRREIKLRLTGDMKRYIWSFNGKTLSEESTILIKKGEVLQMRLINDSMMHHPIHLHGHFFRVLNGKGDKAPLKHTVDVHPMGTRIIEFEADQEKDWFFHCHILYHMDAGMSRVIRYESPDMTDEPNLDPALINPLYFMGEVAALSMSTEFKLKLMTGRNDLILEGFSAYEDDDNEYEIDLTWQHYFNQDFTSFIGYRQTDIEDTRDRGIAGFYYRLPLMVNSMLSFDTEGDARFGLEKDFQLFDRLSLFIDAEYDTNTFFENTVGLNYMLNRDFSLILQYDSESAIDGGIVIRF
ncbi:MAG: multicopper oxidase domain-containing protein, partial [Lentisphaeria bacterium]|nr:multicopper oxidase domain-containing protein [Lentisphaeria bacterium]NQZ69393.1 multicopper oxidase domain-containing protein [Lentisphaeria bacterium]